jgi:cobalt-zinc-cadmium efflux system protein
VTAPERHGHRFTEHQHGDSRHAHHSELSSSRPLVIAVALIGSFALVELAGGLWSGSLALLADCGHMATDAAALLFSLAANRVAQRPVSERHSFGLARAEVIAAFVNSLALLTVVAWLLVEGIDRIRQPVRVNGGAVVVIAAVGLVVNLSVAWVLSRHRENLNMRAALLHVLGDLLGSVAALVAGAVITLTGYTVVDPLLSMLVSGLILRSTLGVLKESTMVLLDSVPSGVEFQEVGHALARIEGVRSIHDLHVWSMVPGRNAVSAHLLVDRIEHWPRILREARRVLARDFGIDHVTLQPEWLRNHGSEETIALRELR